LALAGLVVLAAIVLGGKAPPIARASALLLPLWVAARGGVFPASVSGALVTALLSGCTLLLLAVVLWRRPTRRSAIGIAAAVILLAVAPLLVLRAAPELAPPPAADAVAVWFACQALLALATCAYLALASAPLRDVDDAERNGRWGAPATAAALAVGLLGIEAWTPASGTGWPWWYPAAWLVPFRSEERRVG